MLIRLIRKFILAICVVLAIALLILWSRTRTNDLVISSATLGTYHELRIGKSQLSAMAVSTWPKDQPRRLGRVPMPNSVITSLPLPPSKQQALTLLDGSEITLTPNSPQPWWPPFKSAGTAMVGSSFTAQMNGSGSGSSSSVVALPNAKLSIVGSGSLSIQQPSAAPPPSARPNTQTLTTPSTLPASGIVTFATSPPSIPSTQPSLTIPSTQVASITSISISGIKGLSGSTINITGGTLILFASYTYTRYALPIWAVALVVLLPVWWAMLTGFLRARRRHKRRKGGLCEHCGYDLRGNPTGSACPECGAPTRGIPAPPTGEHLIARLK